MSHIIVMPRIYKPRAPAKPSLYKTILRNETLGPVSQYLFVYSVKVIFQITKPIFEKFGLKNQIKSVIFIEVMKSIPSLVSKN